MARSYTVIIGDKIWKRGGKRHHRTFTIVAESELQAKKIALEKAKQLKLSWKPSWAEARKVKDNG